MEINKNTRKVEFIHRPNRFQAFVKLDNEDLMVHVPNTGRCREILIPGSTVILREENNPSRKTPYDLIAGYKGERLINIDSQIPNKVVEEALIEKRIKALSKYNIIQREKTFGSSRFDFKLSELSKDGRTEEEYFLEVKGVTLEVNGKTMFPDAPTERGARHLRELCDVKDSGRGAGVIFLIQMEGVDYFSPHDEMDRIFGEALRTAKAKGVDIMAFDCYVGEKYITLKDEIEVRL
jgi:sugar fermentation stimulation protein A